jgi:hypothetical protein
MLVDVFEAEALTAAVIQAKPEIVIHHLEPAVFIRQHSLSF